MEHHFNIEDAKKYGINAAVILNNLKFWIAKNKANNKHFHNGTYWTYNSIKAFSELFPYMSEKQIRTALENLEELGVIGKGNFNENKYDRSNWFCLVGQADLPCRANGSDSEGECITDSKPNRKTDSKNSAQDFSKVPTFDDFKNHAVEKEKTIDVVDLKKKYDAWTNNDWHDGNGQKIKNWKSKLNSTIPYIKKNQAVNDYHNTKPKFVF
jgi:hypothetical protein